MASISIGVAEDGKHLQMKTFNVNHTGHDGSEAYFEHLPENRRLDTEEKKVAADLMQLRCNKRFLQDKLAVDYNKIVYPKDLQNLASTLKNADDDELKTMVSLLENDYGADVSILQDQDHQFKGLYFSTKEMRSAMESWPEIVFIDGTYKLFTRNFTLMILLVEDSDGGSRVAGVGILSTEERSTLKWFVEQFAMEHQTARSRMRCLMGAKDLTERDVIKEVFSGIPMYICMFHTLRTFSREVTTNKIGITLQERNQSLQLLDQMTKSVSEGAYQEIYLKFCQTVPEPVLHYFNKNWHNIKKEWTKYNMIEGNLGNHTNNRLESINSKIKQMVKRNSTMAAFVKDFFKWLNSRDRDRSNKRVQSILEKDVFVYSDGSTEQQFKEYLTNYAFSMVLKELRTHDAITILKKDPDTRKCLIRSKNVSLTVTDLSCECSAWTSVGLPCRHIFAVEKSFSLPLFAKELCIQRWTKDYNLHADNVQHTPKSQSIAIASRPHVIDAVITPKNLTTHQKRQLLKATMDDMVQVASQCTNAKFENKLNTLKEIQALWRQGHEICVTKAFASPNEDTEKGHFDDHTDKANGTRSSVNKTLRTNHKYPESTVKISDMSASLANLSMSEGDQLLPIQSAESSINCSSRLDLIQLEKPVIMSGRPKAAFQTTLGLPRRKTRAVDFNTRTPEAKAGIILGWLIRTELIPNVLNGEYLIQKKDIQHAEYETLTDAVADDCIDLSVVQSYFEKEAFSVLKRIVTLKRKNKKFTCKICAEVVREPCVLCDCCLLWYHFSCEKLKRAPKAETWFCSECRSEH